MHQWNGSALVQIMACCLFGTKPLSKPMQGYCNWTLMNKLQWNSYQNTKLFIHENASENIVSEMGAILFRVRWVKSLVVTNRWSVNTLRLRQDGRNFADILKCILLNDNVRLSIKISLKFVPESWIDNKSALIQMMTWHQTDDKHHLNQIWLISSHIHMHNSASMC